MLAAHSAPYTLMIVPDCCPDNPREDRDNFGRMVCWHSHYSLGDQHDYGDPDDFLRDLYRKSINDGGKRLVAYLKSKQSRNAYLEYNRSTREWDLYESSFWPGIDKWYVTQSAPKSQLNADGWFIDYMLDSLGRSDFEHLLSDHGDVIILPLYLYDHSVQSISTRSFLGRAQHAVWDSGQVGYIYADRDSILKEFGNLSDDSFKKAERLLVSETELYDHYMQGQCFGYRLYEDDEEIDSCWGFFGWEQEIKDSIAGCLSDECRPLVDLLDDTDDTENEYLEKVLTA